MYLGAVQAGTVPAVLISPPKEANSPLYCLSLPCSSAADQRVVDGWSHLFSFISSSANMCNESSKPIPEDPLMGALLAHYWHAHEGAVGALMHTCKPLEEGESAPERDFFNSWGGTFVHLLGPALMPG